VQAGARQVECTINGIGERAGNASLEEIVMALRTRGNYYGLTTGINTREIYRTSRMVSNITGMRVQANKAIVGANAFAHEAGIHQDGVIKDKTTYEIMKPEDVGWIGENMVMGKHSGRAAFSQRLFALGFTSLNPDELNRAFKRFKDLCDLKKQVFDEDIYAIVEDEFSRSFEGYTLEDMTVTTSMSGKPKAQVKVSRAGETFERSADEGDGPVDVLFKALEAVVGLPIRLRDYSVSSVTSGKDAQGRVRVQMDIDGREVRGNAVHTDTTVASALAYLNAVNRYLMTKDVAVFAGADVTTP
jgi:2-isopropylmalate synthase